MRDRNQKLGRCIVRSQPQPVFEAVVPGVLHLCVPSRWVDAESNEAAVVIGISGIGSRAAEVIPVPYGDESNPVLPQDRPFPVSMEAGEVLWAVSPGQVGMSFSFVADSVEEMA